MKTEPYIFWDDKVTAHRLRELRQGSGHSYERLQKALSISLGFEISIDSLKNYEVMDEIHSRAKATRGMRLETLVAFAKFYGVSCDYLLGLTNEPSPSYNRQVLSQELGLTSETLDTLERQQRDDRTQTLTDIVSSPEFNRIVIYVAEAIERSKESSPHATPAEFATPKELDQMASKLFFANGNGYTNHFVISHNDGIEFELYRARIAFDKMIHGIIRRRGDNGKHTTKTN